MKREIFTLFLAVVFGTVLMAQKPTGVIKRTDTAPIIDGTIDPIWATANTYNIDQPFTGETPTLGASGETAWKALWNGDGIFVLVTVNDDVFSPVYAGTDLTVGYMYDKPEVYFDVNSTLVDGKGAGTDGLGNGNGHYQFAPSPVEGETDGTAASTGTDNHDQPYGWLVNNPSYSVEYFVPFSMLVDADGTEVIKTGEIGFDVTVIDNDIADPLRNRAVWANIGTINESWNNMDDCGIVTLEGAGNAVLATSITISSAGNATTIETEAGTLQMSAVILPTDVTTKTVKWTVTNGTGKAFISSDGVVTALLNGTVTVTATAKDGSGKTASMEITISHQYVTIDDLNLIKNGNFNTDGGLPASWGFWSGNGGTTPFVLDGVVNLMPGDPASADVWNYQFNQSGLTASPDFEYVFSFVAWSDADRTFNCDFEDTEANTYTRYGTDTQTGTSSDWTFDITQDPTRYTFHVIFDKMVETTVQKVQFMIATDINTVYLDSVSLVSVDDMALITVPGVGVRNNIAQTVKVYPNPAANVVNVSLPVTNSKVAIYNSLGRKVDEVLVKGTRTAFDVSGYARGFYFVRVNNETVSKFVK